MDHLWAAGQLRAFLLKINQLADLADQDLMEQIAARESGISLQMVADELLTLDLGLKPALQQRS